MIFLLAVGLLLLGFTGWSLRRRVLKSKQSKCAGCAIANTCPAATCSDKPTVLTLKKS